MVWYGMAWHVCVNVTVTLKDGHFVSDLIYDYVFKYSYFTMKTTFEGYRQLAIHIVLF